MKFQRFKLLVRNVKSVFVKFYVTSVILGVSATEFKISIFLHT